MSIRSLVRLALRRDKPEPVVFDHYDDKSLREHHRACWAQMPDDLKKLAVDHLRTHFPPEVVQEVRKMIAKDPDGWSSAYHFFWGMSVRNLLREVIKDDQLPPVQYEDGNSYRNWDDFYVMAVEEAVARP